MFSRGSRTGTSRTAAPPIHTILGEGSLWQGEIHAGAEGLRIEGRVEGSIQSEGQVVVAPTGLVKGSIHARHLTVSGRVEGVFKIEGCLEIHGTGWVDGEVESGSLVVDEGGTLQGSCTKPAPARAVERDPVPLAPRREEWGQDRPAFPAASGAGDFRPPRGPERHKP